MKALKSAIAIALIAVTVACSTTWVTEAVNILKVAAPAAVNILTLIAAFEGRPVDARKSAIIINDFNAAITELQNYASASASAQPGLLAQLDAALVTTQNDLASILVDVHVSNPTKVAQINALVSFVISEVAAVQSLLPNAPVTARKIPVDSKHFKRGYNAIMKDADPALVLK